MQSGSSPASLGNPGRPFWVHVEVQAVNPGVSRGDRLLVCGHALPLMRVDVCGCIFFAYCSFTLQFFTHSISAHMHIPTSRTPTFLSESMPLQRDVGGPQQRHYSLNMSFTPTHTPTHTHMQRERDVKHIRRCTQGLLRYAQRCSSGTGSISFS